MDTNPGDQNRRLYRIPPFRDAHVHFLKDGKPLSPEQLPELVKAYAHREIRQVCDMGHRGMPGLQFREEAGSLLRIRTAGAALYRRGGYGTFLGIGVESTCEIDAAIEQIAAGGADFLKVINSGIVSADGGVTRGGFSPLEMKRICSAAAARGLTVACHANGDDAIRSAVEAGAASIEHGFFVSAETLRRMSDRGVSWTPTMYALLSFCRALPAGQQAGIADVVARHLESIANADAMGVQLRVGTDSGAAGVEHGSSFMEELRLFRKAGLSLERIIAAACMDDEEIEKGGYLIVREDFIETGAVPTGVVSGSGG